MPVPLSAARQANNSKTSGVTYAVTAREDKVYYHVMIVSGEEGNTTITHVMVNAIDGTIVKTEKELPRKQRSPE